MRSIPALRNANATYNKNFPKLRYVRYVNPKPSHERSIKNKE